jgi:ribosomal protein S14
MAAAPNSKILLKKKKKKKKKNEKKPHKDRCSICGKKLKFARTTENLLCHAGSV